MTVYNGYVESDAKVKARLERRNAEHERILKQREEAEKSASAKTNA